jgi:hypothetical protein
MSTKPKTSTWGWTNKNAHPSKRTPEVHFHLPSLKPLCHYSSTLAFFPNFMISPTVNPHTNFLLYESLRRSLISQVENNQGLLWPASDGPPLHGQESRDATSNTWSKGENQDWRLQNRQQLNNQHPTSWLAKKRHMSSRSAPPAWSAVEWGLSWWHQHPSQKLSFYRIFFFTKPSKVIDSKKTKRLCSQHEIKGVDLLKLSTQGGCCTKVQVTQHNSYPCTRHDNVNITHAQYYTK